MKINSLISLLHKLVYRKKKSCGCPEPVFNDALFSLLLYAMKCVEMYRSKIATSLLPSLILTLKEFQCTRHLVNMC